MELQEQPGKSPIRLDITLPATLSHLLMPHYTALYEGWKKLLEQRYSSNDNRLSCMGVELPNLLRG